MALLAILAGGVARRCGPARISLRQRVSSAMDTEEATRQAQKTTRAYTKADEQREHLCRFTRLCSAFLLLWLVALYAWRMVIDAPDALATPRIHH